jgi:hypothetical protein
MNLKKPYCNGFNNSKLVEKGMHLGNIPGWRGGGGVWVFLENGFQWRLFLIPFHQLVLHSNEMKSLCMFIELEFE